jgi:hypothetical protein
MQPRPGGGSYPWTRFALAYPLYRLAVTDPGIASQVALNVVAFATAGLSGAIMYDLQLRALPERTRALVFGLIYALAVSIFGGATQPFVTWLILRTGDVMVPAYVALGVIPLGIVALLMLARRRRERGAASEADIAAVLDI